MAKSVSFTDKRVQIVPESTTKGAFLKLVNDTSTYKDGAILETTWGQLSLSEIELDEISEELKQKWREALGCTSYVDTEPPKLVLIDPIADITEEGDRIVTMRVYVDD